VFAGIGAAFTGFHLTHLLAFRADLPLLPLGVALLAALAAGLFMRA